MSQKLSITVSIFLTTVWHCIILSSLVLNFQNPKLRYSDSCLVQMGIVRFYKCPILKKCKHYKM